jgi:TetR/AcrR family transcriptional regulator, mexJK operon transcriptional repressor
VDLEVTEGLSPEKRAVILTGAASVFAEDGYEGASMSRIAARAGVSKGTLYNHFESKADLFAAYVESECSRKLAYVFDAAAESRDDPASVLGSIGMRMLEMVLSPTGLTIYRMVVSEAGKFPELAETFYEAGPARSIRHMACWLREQTKAGRLSVQDPEFAAEQFFALCQTRLALRRKLQMQDEPGPGAVRRVVDAAVAMFLRTYGA